MAALDRYRVLVTGSRTWTNRLLIEDVLIGLLADHGSITLVHGACPKGVDQMADDWAKGEPGVSIARYPAQWGVVGKRAGFIRNQCMVDLGADLCLAFIRGNSRGATHCADAAERAGIEVRRWRA